MENPDQEIFSAYEGRAEAGRPAEKYEKKLTEIRAYGQEYRAVFGRIYSADPEEVLPEAGPLKIGKSSPGKKAKPLIKKIVTVLRSVYRVYTLISPGY